MVGFMAVLLVGRRVGTLVCNHSAIGIVPASPSVHCWSRGEPAITPST